MGNNVIVNTLCYSLCLQFVVLIVKSPNEFALKVGIKQLNEKRLIFSPIMWTELLSPDVNFHIPLIGMICFEK